MKKLLGIMAIALLGIVWTCQAVDYNNHFYDQRVYRVALGSGTVPAASDMALIGLHNGDMVLNTDDDCLYIMHATNVYTKMTSAGTVTLAAMSVPLASNKVYVGNSSGVANEKTLSGLFTITTAGVATNSRQDLALTNATVSGAALSGVVTVITNGSFSGAVLSGVATVITNGSVAGGVLSGVATVLTNGSVGAVSGVGTSLTTTALIMVTNGTIAVALTPQYGNLAYLDTTSNAVTNAIMTNCIVASATFTPLTGTNQVDPVLHTGDITPVLTLQSGTPAVSTVALTLLSGTPAVSAPVLTLQSGTPVVSAPSITLKTGIFVQP